MVLLSRAKSGNRGRIHKLSSQGSFGTASKAFRTVDARHEISLTNLSGPWLRWLSLDMRVLGLQRVSRWIIHAHGRLSCCTRHQVFPRVCTNGTIVVEVAAIASRQ